MESEDKLYPFNVYYCGCFKAHDGYYCPECGFASINYPMCNKHGEMESCWILDLVLFHPIEGLMNALISDFHLIHDEELLQLIRDNDNADEVAGMASALLPLLTPLKVYPMNIFPNRFLGYSSSITLKSIYITEKPLITSGDGKIRVIKNKDPKEVWEEVNLEEGFNENELVVVKQYNNTLYLLSKAGKWDYKITYGKIGEKMKLKGILSTVNYMAKDVKVPITRITPVEGGKKTYLDAVGISGGKVYVVLNNYDKLASCGVSVYDNILPPVLGGDEE